MTPPIRQKLMLLGQSIIVLVAYVAAAKFGLRFALVQANATTVWAPTGIAIAALLIFGYRLWPAVFLAAFITNVTTAGTPVAVAMGIAVGNTLEGFLAAYLVNHFARGVRAFERSLDIFKFALFAVVGCSVSATVGVTSLALGGLVSHATYFSTWLTWWLGDLAGAAIIAPLLITLYVNRKFPWKGIKLLELISFGLLLAVFNILVVQNRVILFYLVFPIFAWAAVRFGRRVTAAAIFILTEVSLWATLSGIGPFISQSRGATTDALIYLDAAMISFAVTLLALAAAVSENEKAVLAQDAMLSGIGDGVVVMDEEEKIAFVNEQAAKYLGTEVAEIIGKDYCEAIPMLCEDGIPIPRAERPLLRAFRTGEKIVNNPFARIQYYVRKDGSRFPVSYTKTPVMIHGEIVGAIDVFREADREEKIVKEKVDFISLASHQLRTPLSVIGLSTELLQGQGSLFGKYDAREIGSYTKDIQTAAQQMVDIVNDLLSISRLESGALVVAPEPVEIGKVAQRIMDELSIKIKGKRLQVHTRFSDGMPGFVVDPLLLNIILENLIGNAVKYTPEEGKIQVSTVQDETSLVIVVSDTGHGVPAEEQAKIFDKFFRASNATQLEKEGSGLGLYIVKGVVERLGGMISFVSKEGEGSTFVVRLPMSSLPPASQEE